ncbi:MAG: LysM peptidoglycan-binding domain-containing protein [Clostridiales bacterium]|nr:LysM peptidoglycan-binding domain-containing protein [Clostridiales bacterium]
MNIKKRRIFRKRLRNLLIGCLMVLAFCSGFFGHSILSAQAQERNTPASERYYTCIRLERGDNLWQIASRYANKSGYSIPEYVEELKRMNGLDDEQIHFGEYLTIVYSEPGEL